MTMSALSSVQMEIGSSSDPAVGSNTIKRNDSSDSSRRTFTWPSPSPERLNELPSGYSTVTEGSATIALSPGNESVFYNPVQAFNRDISVAAIQAWSQLCNEEARARFEMKTEKKRRKKRRLSCEPNGKTADQELHYSEVDSSKQDMEEICSSGQKFQEFRPLRYSVLEALSATGLRAIRYIKELSYVREVIANDVDPGAVERIEQNIRLNGLDAKSRIKPESGDLQAPIRYASQIKPNLSDAM